MTVNVVADESGEAGRPFHAQEHADVIATLGSDRHLGLRSGEAAARLARHGPNVLDEDPPRTILRLVVAQFTDFTILILIAAAGVSGILGDMTDMLMIFAIVAINGVVGGVQEFRSERALHAVKKLAPSRALVLRDGNHQDVAAADIVPGDMVIIEAGVQVPADLRLVDANQAQISEASLTGESVPVEKHTRTLPAADVGLADRRNMAFKGTTVLNGRALGVAVATGMRTEIGRIAALLDSGVHTQTPLQNRLSRFGRVLALAIAAVCILIFVTGLVRGEPAGLMFLTAVTLAVAAIPEALPATVTIALAFGARRMAARNALVRRLSAVEGLGSVTYICSDKTGTLTRNVMTAELAVTASGRLDADEFAMAGEGWRRLFLALALNNDADIGDGKTTGDPTEVALLAAAMASGLDPADVRRRLPRASEIAFDSDRKRMTTIHPEDGAWVAFTKGAPEAVIARCEKLASEGGATPLVAQEWLNAADQLAADGRRVLAVAERRWSKAPGADIDVVEDRMVLLGLIGLMDPPRDEAVGAVAACRAAGITPVMITGDHAATARAIAARLGILAGDGEVVTGKVLARMSDDDLGARVKDIRVFARVNPAQKIRVVEALQRRGEFVAVTGDGVNDAPALRQADIGVAMGRGGTDVAREVADLVLLDDNFATIVAAVREGRRIYDNLRKVIAYVMTGNTAEILAIFLAPFLSMPIPLLPVQILWVNLLSDGLPALALTNEPEEPGTMSRPPRPPGQNFFADGVWQHILAVGGFVAAVTLGIQAYALGTGLPHWQTMVFTVLTIGQALLALAMRAERRSIFEIGMLTNLPMLGAAALVIGLQLAVIYVPPLQAVFGTAPLNAFELAICGIAAVAILAFAEAWKAVRRMRGASPVGPHPKTA